MLLLALRVLCLRVQQSMALLVLPPTLPLVRLLLLLRLQARMVSSSCGLNAKLARGP